MKARLMRKDELEGRMGVGREESAHKILALGSSEQVVIMQSASSKSEGSSGLFSRKTDLFRGALTVEKASLVISPVTHGY